jgi:integrase
MARSYKARWWEEGVKRQKSFPTRTLRDDFLLRLRTRRFEPATITFGEFAGQWLEEYARVMKAETTVLEDERAISRYLMPALASLQLSEITESTLLELRGKLKAQAKLRGQGTLSVKTVNNVLTLAKTIAYYAVRKGLLQASPWERVELLPRVEQDFDFWTVDERERFLAHCRSRDPELWELALVACHTGLRRGELKALERGQLDLETRQIRVNATYSEKLKRRLNRTKSRRSEVVRMNEPTYLVLRSRALAAPSAPVFRPELFSDLYDRLQRRCKEFGMRAISPHDWRHTFASTLVMGGVPIYTVQKLMRHGSVQMTERYAHLAPAYQQDAVETIVAKPKSAVDARRTPEGAKERQVTGN